MTNPTDEHSFRRHLGFSFIVVAVVVIAGFLYVRQVPAHPPGFYIDESSIAYNAYLISRTGRDEHGQAWPIYFRAFGDYKNPTYIYLLAALFRATGPSITAARLLSATLGLLTGFLLGWLGWRLSSRLSVGLIVAISAWLTPWLFESSRLVFEVSIYPALLLLFLLALQRAATRDEWNFGDILALSLTLALLTYSYSIGRLLAPLLAAGLGLFITRRRLPGVVQTWLAYTVTLVPLFIFTRNHPGALTGRFKMLTYIKPSSGYAEIGSEFVRHFAANLNPWRWLATGENNIRDHVAGHGSLLVVTTLMGVLGLILVVRNHRNEAWWRFVVYALIVSVVPASLTSNEFPQLRLIAFPVFFHVLLVPPLRWLFKTQPRPAAAYILKRVVIAVMLVLIVAQGIFFQRAFHKAVPELWYVFDARFPRKVLATALATGKRPIYLVDSSGKSGYIQALWYATLQDVSTGNFIRAANGQVPASALVISSEEDCSNCTLIVKSINYTVYSTTPNDVTMSIPALPPEALRAQITAANLPMTLNTGSTTETSVQVKNLSTATWPAVGESGGGHAVTLHGRWLRTDGTLMSEAGVGNRFPYDLEPGDTAGVTLKITAPQVPGQYILELEVVQEQVARFGSQGSYAFRQNLNVEPWN